MKKYLIVNTGSASKKYAFYEDDQKVFTAHFEIEDNLPIVTEISEKGKEKKVKSPYENQFLKRHNLTAVSSVKLAIQSLTDKTLILKDEEDCYSVYDRFFSLWLEKR